MPDKIAYIREAECIGCIKCIKACSDQAILGARKQMHTIITDLCTGCEDCIAVCPVDCIEMMTISAPSLRAQAYPAASLRGAQRRSNPGSILDSTEDLDCFATLATTETSSTTIDNNKNKKDLIAAAIARTLERRGWSKT